ncbi:trypsin-like peptidase domain-containing protein [Roseateles asaccharophilus]|uniref:S1-C subfamily serine protease n=1 Tax=Roseateles asaccharophilus TaxID=582607 RepID=A0ABU2AEL5_9BURK|nr:trypsin-like peptidase domain-containing protein [Roseateles asaccharophilus]MDR7335646.1 S1-C subfamily serine protease [Roseateles asaccharophilus]
MKNLQEATERICELKGSLVAFDALMPAVIDTLSATALARLMASFDAHAEAARTVMLHSDMSDMVLNTFEREIARNRALLQRSQQPVPRPPRPAAVDPLLLATTRITTFVGSMVKTSASGFFFRRGDQLFLVSNRHVFADAASAHLPDRIEIGLHTDAQDLTRHAVVSLPLYRHGLGQWREATDSGGTVDVAVMALPSGALPADAVLLAFDETHLDDGDEAIAIGDALTIPGFPLGFHDTIHHLAVARHAAIASAYGVRFQRQGCFLTDARTHRGSSGSPVVRRRNAGLPGAAGTGWQLLGVHSTRMDMRDRDLVQDESLGLNCAWYADVLLTLTADAAKASP